MTDEHILLLRLSDRSVTHRYRYQFSSKFQHLHLTLLDDDSNLSDAPKIIVMNHKALAKLKGMLAEKPEKEYEDDF